MPEHKYPSPYDELVQADKEEKVDKSNKYRVHDTSQPVHIPFGIGEPPIPLEEE